MKTTLLLIFTVFLTINSFAQIQKAGFNISIPDGSSNSIFDQKPNLEYIHIRYKNGEPSIINFMELSEEGDIQFTEQYYTKFEGDRYTLSKKYPGLKLPQMPKLNVWYFAGIEHLQDSTVQYEVSTNLKRDTLIHNIKYFILSEGTYWYDFSDSNVPPKLKVNISDFQKKLTLAYKQWKPIEVADSALVFTGTVTIEGSFGDAKLSTGNPSPFSDKILRYIGREASSWMPGKASYTKNVNFKTRIFVRLNPDDTITFTTL